MKTISSSICFLSINFIHTLPSIPTPESSHLIMPAFMHPCYSLAFVIEPSTTKGDQLLPVKRLFRSSAAASTADSSLASGGSWKLILTEQRPAHGARMYVQVE